MCVCVCVWMESIFEQPQKLRKQKNCLLVNKQFQSADEKYVFIGIRFVMTFQVKL